MGFILKQCMMVLIFVVLIDGQEVDEIKMPPKVTFPKNPTTSIFNEFSSPKLNCSATGIPKPQFRYLYNGTTTFPSVAVTVDRDTGVLTINDITKREQGVYQCLAYNEIVPGQIVSAFAPAVTVQVYMLDKFTDQTSVTVSVNEWEPYSLMVRDPPRSQPKAKFAWYLDKDIVDPSNQVVNDASHHTDNEGNLHFIYTEAKDTGNPYKCALESKDLNAIHLGSPYNFVVIAQPNPPPPSTPNILYFTSNAKALIQDSAKLECVFSGRDIQNIRWYDTSGKLIPTVGDASGKYGFEQNSFGRQLEIKNLVESDEGTYTCEAINTLGLMRKQAVYLNVTARPIPVEILYDTTVPEGQDARLPCKTRPAFKEASGGFPTWYQDGNKFTHTDTTKYVFNSDRTELTVTNVKKPADIHCYRCVTNNEHGETYADGCLNIIKPIVITVQPSLEQRIKHGGHIDLTVEATTDISMQNDLHTRAKFKGQTYEYNLLAYPPFAEYNPETHEVIINTSKLNDEEFKTVNGTYIIEKYHPYETVSVTIEVILEGVVIAPPGEEIAAAGTDLWWIALVIGILLLIIVIIIICTVCWYRKTQEGVYPVDKTERAADLDPVKDLENAGFHDLSRADDDYAPYRPPPPGILDNDNYGDYEDDEGSLGQYGDLDAGKFNEDGSFIGLYGTNKPDNKPPPSESTI